MPGDRVWLDRARPQSFYGPEDASAMENWEETQARIERDQVEWDRRYAGLSWWGKLRLLFSLTGIDT